MHLETLTGRDRLSCDCSLDALRTAVAIPVTCLQYSWWLGDRYILVGTFLTQKELVNGWVHRLAVQQQIEKR